MAEQKIWKKTRGPDGSSSSPGFSDSSSSSLSSRPRKLDTKFPVLASDWNSDHLSRLGIEFDDRPTGLPVFISVLRQRVDSDAGRETHQLHDTLLQFTRESWTFSFDFDKQNSSKQSWDGVKVARTQAEGAMKELQEERRGMAERLQTTHSGLERYCITMLNAICQLCIDFW
jgi:hypothetical protein